MIPPVDLHALPLESPEALREALLAPTLARAARIPYYRARWGSRWKRVRTARDLALLPLLTKAEAARHQESLRAPGARVQVGTISSGTTSGDLRPLRILRDPREGEALGAFERALAARRGRRDDRRRAGRVLEVRSVHHGLPCDEPLPERERLLWTHDSSSFEQVEAALRRRRGPRFTGLVIGAGALMPLTLHLLARGVEPSDLGVEVIGTTSFRLTGHWRAFVEETWGARVFDNYSLSEFASYALECERCGFGHWSGPPLLPEVVDPRSRRPIRDGVGALVLTGLFPFVQVMPLVRYFTGDLVELGPHCPAACDRGVRWRGRLGQSLFSPEGALWIAAGDVVEVLEALPDVARAPHPAEALGLVSSVDCGPVKYALSRTARGARLVVELRFDPATFAGQARALEREIARALRRRSPALGRASLAVAAVRPATLTAPWSKW